MQASEPGSQPRTHPPAPRTLVHRLAGNAGGTARVCGWLQHGHPSGNHQVNAVLADHTGTVRLVVADEDLPNCGSAVEAVGEVVPGPAPGAGVELVVHRLTVCGPAAAGLPVNDTSPPAAWLDWRYLGLRRPSARLVFTVQSTLERALRAAWAEADFIELHSPKLIPTGPRPQELFNLSYFDRRAWLVQSPQFYKQMAIAAGLDRVFEIGPVFRAEPALTPVHATEFTSLDVEMAWIDSHEDVMDSAEAWLRSAVGEVAARHDDEIARLLGVTVEVPAAPFPRLTLAEAWDVVAGMGHPGGDGDLDREGERLLGEHVAAEHGHQLVWITDYPELTRPFYHMRSREGSAGTRSFDLLWRGLEVASGAQREHRHDRLLAQARARDVALEPISHYLDFFRFGCPPHGGLGFGLNRMLMCLLHLPDIREAAFVPRDRDRLYP